MPIIVTPPPEPEPLSESATVYMPPSLKSWLVAEASRKGESQSAFILRALLAQRNHSEGA